MYKSKGKPGWHEIDGQRVYTDSLAEAAFIKRLVKDGFSKKWRRTRTGIGSGRARYTPDLELSIDINGQPYRALVEYKSQSATEFKVKDRRRFNGIIKHYSNALPFLYIHKTRQWYQINSDGKLTKVSQPRPGALSIDALPKPAFTVPVFNRYARVYQVRPLNFTLKALADGLELCMTLLFGIKKRKRKNRASKWFN